MSDSIFSEKHGFNTTGNAEALAAKQFVENVYSPKGKTKFTLIKQEAKLDKAAESPAPKKSFAQERDEIVSENNDSFVSADKQERLWAVSVQCMTEDAQDLQKRCLAIISAACGAEIESLGQSAKLVKILPQHVGELPLPDRRNMGRLFFLLEEGEFPVSMGMKSLRSRIDNSVVPVVVPDQDGFWHGLWQDTQGSMRLAYNNMKRLELLIMSKPYSTLTTKQIIEQANSCAVQLQDVVEKLDRTSLCKELDWTEFDVREARKKK